MTTCIFRGEPTYEAECLAAVWSQGSECKKCSAACYRAGMAKILVDADNRTLVRLNRDQAATEAHVHQMRAERKEADAVSEIQRPPTPPKHRMRGTVTVRKSVDTPTTIEASGDDPEAVIWDLVKQGIQMLGQAKNTAPGRIGNAKAEVEIETEHFAITIKWSRAAHR